MVKTDANLVAEINSKNIGEIIYNTIKKVINENPLEKKIEIMDKLLSPQKSKA